MCWWRFKVSGMWRRTYWHCVAAAGEGVTRCYKQELFTSLIDAPSQSIRFCYQRRSRFNCYFHPQGRRMLTVTWVQIFTGVWMSNSWLLKTGEVQSSEGLEQFALHVSMYFHCMFMYDYPDWGFFPCVFFSCKANGRVKPAKTGHGPHSS